MVFASTSSVRTTVLEQNHLCNEAAATAARLEPLRQSNRNEVLSFYFIIIYLANIAVATAFA